MDRRIFRRELIVGVLWMLIPSFFPDAACGAIAIDNFSAATNDRFYNSGSFIADAYDLSGVGRNTRWATLIDRNIFISAAHHHPAIGTNVYFYPGNDPSASPIARMVAGGQSIAGTDLYVGHFDYALPSSITHYAFPTTDLTEATFGGSFLDNEFAYMSGLSPTSTGYGAVDQTRQAVGKNHIEVFWENQTVQNDPSTGDVVTLIQNDPGDPGGFIYETYEANVVSGDSGSPLFVDTDNDGALEVVGTAWFTGTLNYTVGETQYTRPISGYTYIGNYDQQVQAYIDSNLIVVVPEPSTLNILGCGVLVYVFYRWRRRSS